MRHGDKHMTMSLPRLLLLVIVAGIWVPINSPESSLAREFGAGSSLNSNPCDRIKSKGLRPGDPPGTQWFGESETNLRFLGWGYFSAKDRCTFLRTSPLPTHERAAIRAVLLEPARLRLENEGFHTEFGPEYPNEHGSSLQYWKAPGTRGRIWVEITPVDRGRVHVEWRMKEMRSRWDDAGFVGSIAVPAVPLR